MISLQLTPEQSALMLNANEPVYLLDADGKKVGTAKKFSTNGSFTEEEIEAARRAARTPGPRFTTAQVLEMLAEMDAQPKW